MKHLLSIQNQQHALSFDQKFYLGTTRKKNRAHLCGTYFYLRRYIPTYLSFKRGNPYKHCCALSYGLWDRKLSPLESQLAPDIDGVSQLSVMVMGRVSCCKHAVFLNQITILNRRCQVNPKLRSLFSQKSTQYLLPKFSKHKFFIYKFVIQTIEFLQKVSKYFHLKPHKKQHINKYEI